MQSNYLLMEVAVGESTFHISEGSVSHIKDPQLQMSEQLNNFNY